MASCNKKKAERRFRENGFESFAVDQLTVINPSNSSSKVAKERFAHGVGRQNAQFALWVDPDADFPDEQVEDDRADVQKISI